MMQLTIGKDCTNPRRHIFSSKTSQLPLAGASDPQAGFGTSGNR